jgi:hypothetical protein
MLHHLLSGYPNRQNISHSPPLFFTPKLRQIRNSLHAIAFQNIALLNFSLSVSKHRHLFFVKLISVLLLTKYYS